MATIQQPSNIVWQSVSLTDDVKINLQYDIHRGCLNIFVKNIGDTKKLPCQINVLSDQNETIAEEFIPDGEPMICYEVSTTYSYDLTSDDDDEDIHGNDCNQTILISSSSSCSDVQTLDNDDGYSTHSHDDTEPLQQQLSLMIPPVKSLRPSFSFFSYHSTSEQSVLSVRRLIEHITWFNPFKKTIQQMMIHEIFA